jgi:hypothetical protein
MTIRAFAAAFVAAVLLSACAGSSNMVVAPNRSDFNTQSVTLRYEGATLDVEQESVDELQKYMKEEFFGKKGAFTEGPGMTVKYGFMTFDEGSQAARYLLLGIGGGEAKMVVRAEFLDADGHSLAVIQSEGRLNGGLFGGDAGSAIHGAAKEISAYASENFAAQ